MKFKITEVKAVPDSKRSGEPYPSKAKIYLFIKGESIMEDLIGRHNRPYTYFQTDVLPRVMVHLKKKFKSVYDDLKNEKWVWSQKCGCTCGCSPGFVGEKWSRTDIYVDVKFYK